MLLLSAILLIACSAFIGSDAQAVTCDVGEQEHVNGLCRSGGDNSRCTEYCQRKYREELVGAQCSEERRNGKRECFCKLKCCNIGGWGDPHYWTCDGVKFGYQGLKKHFLMKPINEYPTMPNFYITQVNRPWGGNPAAAVLDSSELVVPEWRKTFELKVPDPQSPNIFVFKVDGQRQDIPYRYSVIDNNRERFVTVLYGDVARTQVVLVTSFGVRMTWSSKVSGPTAYSDLAIDFPRHPELKDNSHGLLGRWNGNPADDTIDADGHKQPVDDMWSWQFGDSWIVREGRTPTAKCDREEKIRQKEQKIKEIDPEDRKHVQKMCVDALETDSLKNCAVKLGRAIPLVKNCVNDLLLMEDHDLREEYLNELVDVFKSSCQRVSKGGGGGANIKVKVEVNHKKKRDAKN